MTDARTVRVAVNGYGVIGKRVADAVAAQNDMTLAGVADVTTDWSVEVARGKGYRLYGATADHAAAMDAAGLDPAGDLGDLLDSADIVVDCTPKKVAAANVERYRERGLKFIVQGGETQTPSRGTPSVPRTTTPPPSAALPRALSRATRPRWSGPCRRSNARGSSGRARGTLLRRATDPWESHLGGIMNTLVPEPEIPSHQGPDARTVDPELDVVTMAVKVPETLAHLHYWTVELTRQASKEDVLAALRTSSRIAFIRTDEGLTAINSVKELTADLGRPHANLYEVALWEDMLSVQGDEAFYAYMVDNQAIVVPETIDAVRALTELESDGAASIRRTNEALGITGRLVPEPADR